ncbi:MAG: hypothetical protein FWD06_05420 [Oscillospiraceae bacterium]|nr:hypothetical protein [Oscillospiraceae bacterium]
MKKLISALLALALGLGLFAVHASAAQERDPLLFRVAPATVGQSVIVIPISAQGLGPDLWILYEPTACTSAFTRHNLRRNYTQLTGQLNSSSGTNAAVLFYGDGRLLHEIELPTSWYDRNFSINVAGVRQLEIRVRAAQPVEVDLEFAWLNTRPYAGETQALAPTAWQEMHSIPWQMLHAGVRPSGVRLFWQAFRHDIMHWL